MGKCSQSSGSVFHDTNYEGYNLQDFDAVWFAPKLEVDDDDDDDFPEALPHFYQNIPRRIL
jgi:hypothetical protein